MIPPQARYFAGSPPQVRGKPHTAQTINAQARITPAGAGKTLYAVSMFSPSADHPRRCGENEEKERYYRHQQGSPPRMRGKLRYNLAKVIQIRITPADAGKTRCFSNHGLLTRDHPRGCGENVPVLGIAAKLLGSPPRMRGKPACSAASICLMRITPADAGKTPVGIVSDGRPEDHPRGCGENKVH